MLSLSEKANLRKDLESWRGKAFTAEELKGFDIEKLIGVNAMASIIHNQSGDRTYANISSISKLMKGLQPMATENKRTLPEWIDKLRQKAVTMVDETEQEPTPAEVEGEEIPF